jgi:ketosteroid isomerase-like protein
MSGRSLVSGRFQGRDDLYAHIGKHVLGPLVVGTEPYVKGSRLIIDDGDIGVGLLHGGLPAHDGGRYDQFYLQIFRYKDGLIQEIIELFDTVMVESALMKNRLSTPRPVPAVPFNLDAPGLVSQLSREEMVGLAKKFTNALTTRDIVGAAASLSPNAQIRVIGSTPLSGCTDDAAILAKLFGAGIVDARVVAADGTGAVVLAKAGDPGYAQQYGLVIEADGARIGCISLFLDTVEAEAWQFGNPILPAASVSIMPPFDVTKAL